MKRLIFGCGYLGSRVARLWLESRGEADEFHVVTRSTDRAKHLQRQGMSPMVADVTEPASLKELPQVETVLYAVSWDRQKGRSMEEVYVEGLRNVLEALPPFRRFIYVSSTGVYGQDDGGWVDEDSPCQPTRESGRVCLAAEAVLEDFCKRGEAVILRLAGIYGPHRIPNLRAVETGEEIASGEGYLNLIHAHDAAATVLAAERHPSPSAMYLVSDGQPAQRWEFYREAARLLGAPPPRFVAPPAGSAKAQRGQTNRRISNARLLEELKLELQFLSYRQGLQAIIADKAEASALSQKS